MNLNKIKTTTKYDEHPILKGILLSFIYALIMQILWNLLLPQLFHFPYITYWQALGLRILIKNIF